MKNILALGTVLFLVTATALEAKDCCECCPPKCAQLCPSGGPDWMITPGAGPCTADGCDLAITAEFIYWAVRQDHMAFGAVFPGNYASNVTNPPTNEGKFIEPNWQMEPGFRVGASWLSCHDGWDLSFNYTWLRPRTKTRSITKTDETLLTGVFLPFDQNIVGTNTTTNTSGKWDIDFNTVDLEWGRNFYISKCLHLRPHFGLKATWIEQRLLLSATAIQSSLITFFPTPLTRNIKSKIEHWGLGPRAGLDSAWHFSQCFSVVGEVAATAIWGQFSLKNSATETNDNTNVTTPITSNVQTKWHTVKPVIELFLGFRYEDWWCCDEYYTGFDIGWEVQWWSGQNQFIVARESLETRWGDLAFQGLTIRARFQF